MGRVRETLGPVSLQYTGSWEEGERKGGREGGRDGGKEGRRREEGRGKKGKGKKRKREEGTGERKEGGGGGEQGGSEGGREGEGGERKEGEGKKVGGRGGRGGDRGGVAGKKNEESKVGEHLPAGDFPAILPELVPAGGLGSRAREQGLGGQMGSGRCFGLWLAPRPWEGHVHVWTPLSTGLPLPPSCRSAVARTLTQPLLGVSRLGVTVVLGSTLAGV